MEQQKEEKKYPIYEFSARWIQTSNKEYPENWKKGLSENKIWNSTSFRKMYKEEQEISNLEGFLMTWWKKYYVKKNLAKKEAELFCLEVKFLENETWNLTWFTHETFDVGQSDKEVLKSFERFVQRKEALNEESQYSDGEDKYCLMGAEDRWRWRGLKEGSTPPCRCEDCKKAGMIRISH